MQDTRTPAQIWASHPRWKRVSVYVSFGFLASVLALIALAPEPEAKPQAVAVAEPTPTPKEPTAQELIEAQFSPWDGRHVNLSRAIRDAMNDPKSFSHISTRYRVNTDGTLGVVTEFTGRNAFGGVIRQRVAGIVDAKTGDVLEWRAIE